VSSNGRNTEPTSLMRLVTFLEALYFCVSMAHTPDETTVRQREPSKLNCRLNGKKSRKINVLENCQATCFSFLTILSPPQFSGCKGDTKPEARFKTITKRMRCRNEWLPFFSEVSYGYEDVFHVNYVVVVDVAGWVPLGHAWPSTEG